MGEYRAPKGRERLNEYFWFCLNHVREYNKAWDYYAGMSERECHLVGWQNSSKFFRYDPFAHMSPAEATVGGLRARAADVDVSTTSRAEYRRRYHAAA